MNEFRNDNGNGSWGMNPRRTANGIKAHSAYGDFGRNWWSRRWIAAMEKLVSGPRLMRGQYYAREGQVISIEETREGVLALVQGSRPRPYKVSIRLAQLSMRQWNKVMDVLADQAIFAAKLLAGEMPAEIEEAFEVAGVSLFPQTSHDLMTDCTCPDKANPCKHVAATHYILAERFDEDPFLLFRMRGRTQEQILTGLRLRRAGKAVETQQPRRLPPYISPEDGPRLEETLDRYWQIGREMQEFSVKVTPPEIPQPLLKRLGEPDFVRDLTLQSQLEEAYEAISQFALLLAYGDASNNTSAEEE